MNNSIPKWLIAGLGGLLIAFVALLIVQKANELRITFKNERPANTISVMGEGKVSAVPDLATVTLGVLSQGNSAVDVKNQNNEKVSKIIEYIKDQGIEDKDIATSQFNFYPIQDYMSGTVRITGYSGNQTVTVKVRGVNNDQTVLENILDGSVNNGANEINGVYFSVEKPSDLQNEAKKMAIDDAKKKAQELADQAGLKLGKVISISENSGGYYPPMPYATGGVAMQDSVKSMAPTIEPGSQEITQTMTVVFEVK